MKERSYFKNRKIILIVAAILIISLNLNLVLALDKFYEVNLTYKDFTFKLNSVDMKLGSIDLPDQYGYYSAELNLFNGSILNKTYFATYYTAIIEGNNSDNGLFGGTREVINLTEIIIYLPYHEDAENIVIRNSIEDPIFIIPVSQFSKNLCGDGICQSYEAGKCSVDCANISRPSVPAYSTEVKMPASGGISPLTIVVISLTLILVILIIVLLRKKKPEEGTYEFLGGSQYYS